MEKLKRNPFESLRIPAVRGAVASTDFEADTIYAFGTYAAFQIRTARIDNDAWAFGFFLQIGDLRREMLPGEGAGWFRSKADAMLYALGHIRYSDLPLPEDMVFSIDTYISKIRNVPLFDI